MVRLVGVDLPRNKQLHTLLLIFTELGWRLQRIIEIAGINPETRSNDLTTEETITLRQALEDLDLGNLRRFNGLNIKRLNEINCHRGKRHRNNLPVRGQRTRTNARSKRGSKKTVTGKKNNLKIVS
jgi:small subunit ribosomal protein S13